MTAAAAAQSVRPPVPRRARIRRRDAGWLTYLLLTLLAIFALGPIVLFIFNALKTSNDYSTSALGTPKVWDWDNFTQAWIQGNMGAGLLNSVLIVAGTVIFTVIVSGCAAYALARLEIKGNSAMLSYLLISSSLPTQTFLVPLFYAWTKAGLYDSRIGLVLIYVGLFAPFGTLLLRSFMLTMPKELEEAARMDGASELGVLCRIVLPNALPGLLTVALVTALSAYNEFLFAVTFIQNPDKLPVSTTLYTFQQGFSQNYPLITAAGVIMIAPMLILFLILQRKFIDGLASTGMGGS